MSAHRLSTRSRQSGMSVVEMLVAMAVMLIVVLAIFFMYDTAQQNASRGLARAAAQQDVRSTHAIMTKELRAAGYKPSTTACPTPPAGAITAIGTTSVTLTLVADVIGDGCVRQIIYTFVPPTLPFSTNPCDPSDPLTVGIITRSSQVWTGTTWSPTTPVATRVAQCISGLSAIFYDNNGAVTTNPASVVWLSLSMSAVENSRATTAQTFTLTTGVSLRNL
jgi:Tfp pilus assembly protein PilW